MTPARARKIKDNTIAGKEVVKGNTGVCRPICTHRYVWIALREPRYQAQYIPANLAPETLFSRAISSAGLNAHPEKISLRNLPALCYCCWQDYTHWNDSAAIGPRVRASADVI